MLSQVQQTCHQLWPQVCQLCGSRTPTEIALCQSCWQLLPWHPPEACLGCGKLLPTTPGNQHCSACVTTPPPYTQLIGALSYTTPISRLILDLKFQHRLEHASLLATLLAARISQYPDITLPDCIIPIPLHPSRTRERGFNQALEIAKPLSKALNIPIARHSCTRHKATSAQTSLSAKQRLTNLENAFRVRSLPGQHIAILDDVYTTGATATTLAHALKQAGAKRVDIWACAIACID